MNKKQFIALLAGGRNSRMTQAKTITIDNSNNATELEHYQIKVVLTSDNWNFSRAENDGSDIRVYDSDGMTLLPYYILSYDNILQSGEVWVRVPVIPASDTKEIHITSGFSVSTETSLPIGTFTRPTAPVMTGLAENMVFDSDSNKYYVIFSATTGGPVDIASADSPDGPWTDLGTILNKGSLGQWDDGIIYAPSIVKHNGIWYLYYSAGPDATDVNHSIGVATSTVITGPYTRSISNPIIEYSGLSDWEHVRACEPYVYYSEILNKWVCLYMGDAGGYVETVGYAVADDPDGPWIKYGSNPIIDFGTAPADDSGTVADPFAIEINGVAYIGYTAGSTNARPWHISFCTTEDYITFRKFGGSIYGIGIAGDWDSVTAFRGAVSRFGDYYYLPYAGENGVSAFSWGVAKASAITTSKGFDPTQVFNFFDNFETLDVNKWGELASETGIVSIDNNTLLIDTTLSGGVHYKTLAGMREFGSGFVFETRSKHNNANGLNTQSGQVGLAKPNRDFMLRNFDLNTQYWIKNNYNGGPSSLSNMAQTIDTNWHIHKIFWVSGSSVKYQIDNNIAEEIATNVPQVPLNPWFFVYATDNKQTTMNVDWVRVRKYTSPEPEITIS